MRIGHAFGMAAESEVLMEQTYSEQDDLAHIRWLTLAFAATSDTYA